MGVDVSAEVMIGVWCESQHEAAELYKKIDPSFDLDTWEESGESLEEYLEFPDLLWTNYKEYTGGGSGCLGYEVGESDIELSGGCIQGIYQTAYEVFPEGYRDKVQAHIWARYW